MAGGELDYAQRVTNTMKPTADVAYYDTGAVRYRGFQLDGQMHGDWEFCARTAA
jgi:hypothetical protein